MDEIPWYTDASLVGPNRVFAIGTLAQCLRKWTRLPEIEQINARIRLAKEIEGRKVLEREDIAALAGHPELRRV